MILSENDKWLILSPGRTGSTLIITCLESSYHEVNLYLNFIRFRQGIVNPDLYVCQSHVPSSLSLVEKDAKVVLSTRDMVESALSYCIYPKIGQLHLFPSRHENRISQLQEKIPAFYLSSEDLFWRYRKIKEFYDSLSTKLEQITTIIDYKDIKNDPAAVYSILNIPNPNNYSRLPIKNPGTYEQWITNWDEISEFVVKLERDPLKILKR